MFEKGSTTERRAGIGPLDVRLLAALDLHGWNGTRRRRRIILLEFIVSVVAGLGLGVWMLAVPGDLWLRLFGVAMIGIGCNFVPLTLHALDLWRPGALSAELEGVDLSRELKRYTFLTAFVLVPFLVAVLAGLQQLRARSGPR